jgi:hypothetical protein
VRGKLYTIRDFNRGFILHQIAEAPLGFEVIVREPTRTIPQSDRMWAHLTDIADARPKGVVMSPEGWKGAFMLALGHELEHIQTLDGERFPVGFRSSKLSKQHMADLITFIEQWATENGVPLRDPKRAA